MRADHTGCGAGLRACELEHRLDNISTGRRDGFEPDFCVLGWGRVLEMRARVGSGLTMRAAGRVGPVHLQAFCSVCNFFSSNLWLFGVDLLPSKMNSVSIKIYCQQLWKNMFFR